MCQPSSSDTYLPVVMWNRTQDQERDKRQVPTAGFKGRRLTEACIHSQPNRFSQQPPDSVHAEISHILNQAVVRMESTTRQQGHNTERRLQRAEEKIDHRLREAEVNQAQLSSSVDGLRSQCQALWSENQDLKDTVNCLTNKCDYNDNQSRRNNLLFRNPGRTVKEK